MRKLLSVLSSTLQGGVRRGLLFFALLATTTLWAQSFQVGDLYYRVTSKSAPYTVEVNEGTYSITIAAIPETVTYNGTIYSVTSIGDYAFYDCSSLTSVTIGNSVTSIGDEAFYGCSSLTKTNYAGDIAGWCDIKFGNSYANPIFYSHNFYINDVEIKDLVIPNSVDSIHNYAFCGCSGLTSVTIPNSVTSIGYAAFWGCSSLTSITIPNSVTSIGDKAFRSCSSLTSVTINSDAIVRKAYSYDSNISHIFGSQVTEYIIGESVTSIGDEAFYNCSSLTSITIPNSVTSIGGSAFYGCIFVKENFVNNSVLDAEENNYWGASIGDTEIDGLLIRNDTVIDHRRPNVTSVIIPEGVTSIGSSAFSGCSSLTSVTIPNSVTSIGDEAFSGCSSLTSITIPNSVTSIGEWAFNGCSSLTSVTIPEGVTIIEFSAFRGCSSLTSVTIPESVTSIDFLAFYGCSSLTSVTIPESVTIIRNFAFKGCSSLTSITIPNSVTSIGKEAFYGCSSLTSVTIPNSVTSIGEGAFAYCSALTSITIPEGVTIIEFSAFRGCSSLTSVTIPESVTSIGKEAFYGCSSLTSVTIPNSVTSIGEAAFAYCSSLTSITIPNSVTSIGGWAFNGCSSLTSVTIPNSVTSIEESAFEDCSSLTSVTIPNSVTSIGSSAFSGCYKLISIRCEATTPPTIEASTFYGVSKSIPVYVPAGCAEVYNAAYGWNEFINIVVYTIQVYTSNSQMGTAKVDYNNYFSSQISATANHGYHFVQWSDGNTDNPRTLVLTQDTILTAVFAQSFSGQCGDSLYWELVDTTLHIIGSGAMYDYTPNAAPWTLIRNSIKSITVAEGVTKIGNNAFDGCTVLESVVWNAKNYADASSLGTAPFNNIGSQIKSFTFGNAVEHIPAYICFGMEKLNAVNIPNATTSIGENAFAGCTKLYDIYCYAMEPPTAYESSFANYNAFLHVPCDNQRVYLLDVLFGNFKYIECIEAETIPTDTVVVTPSFNDAEFIWPSNSSADSYTLAISKDGEIFCTLTFNANGQLTGIAFAPSRNGQHNAPAAAQTANGFAFTVTGLDEGANYTYDLLIQDRSGNTLQSYSGEFRTQSTNDRTVTVEYDAAQGQVTGAGTYLVGDTVTLTATPNDGYRFVRWSSEVEDNPYTFVISDNVTLSAEFEAVIHSDVENATPSQQSDTHKLLRDGQLLILRDGKTYNAMGQEL